MQAQGTQAAGTRDGGKPEATSVAKSLAGGDVGELFTTLLVAQIRNQNPLEPTDPSAFVAQLTQLSQTESLQKLLDQQAAQAGLLQSLQSIAMGAQVGSRVMVQADSVTLDRQPLDASVSMPAASAATAVLTGADGRERRVALGPLPAGDAGFRLDPLAHGLPAGRYAIAIENAAGTRLPVEVIGTVSAVRLSPSGGASLSVEPLGEVGAAAVTRYLGRAG